MYQYDDPTAVSQMPPPGAAGTAGYFTDGNPASGQPATLLRADFMNTLMMELVNAIQAGGLVPTKGKNNQLAQVLGGLAPVGISVQSVQKSCAVALAAHTFIEFNGGSASTISLPDPTKSIPVLVYVWNGSASSPLTLSTAVGGFFGQGVPANGPNFVIPPGCGALLSGDTSNYIVWLSCYIKAPPVGDSSALIPNTAWTQTAIAAAINALNMPQYATGTALATAIAGLNIGQYATSTALANAVAPLALASRIGSNAGAVLYQAAANQPLTDIGKLVELSGTFSLNVPNFATATQGPGASIDYINTGNGPVTLVSTGGVPFFINGQSVSSIVIQPSGVATTLKFDGTSAVVTGGAGSAVLSATGLERRPSGLIEMWGQTTAVGPGQAITVTLPATFPNAIFPGVQATPATGTNQPGAAAGAVVISTSQIQLWNNSTSQSFAISWRVNGK
ncbi:gp53-like domain-containing protein [Chromobacterium vaccinii]|uniref:gp53-like domain-containing protein n=1 Tax=Chromobacterium vaccinii TaxID=1108595 RepID=UPI003C722798